MRARRRAGMSGLQPAVVASLDREAAERELEVRAGDRLELDGELECEKLTEDEEPQP